MELLGQVVKSLEVAGKRSRGVQKLFTFCLALYRVGQACIEQHVICPRAPGVAHGQSTRAEEQHQSASERMRSTSIGDNTFLYDPMALGEPSFPSGLFEGSAHEISTLFEDYRGGNANLLDVFDGDVNYFENFTTGM